MVMCNTHFQDNDSTNIYNCKTKIIYCTRCSKVVEIKLHQFSKFSTPLRNSSQVVNLLQICPPAPVLSQICLPDFSPCSKFVQNFSTWVAPLLQICLKCVNQTCHPDLYELVKPDSFPFSYLSPCSRFVLSFFPRVPLLQILHTSSLSSKCLYIYWKLAFGFVSYLPPAPDSIYLWTRKPGWTPFFIFRFTISICILFVFVLLL